MLVEIVSTRTAIIKHPIVHAVRKRRFQAQGVGCKKGPFLAGWSSFSSRVRFSQIGRPEAVGSLEGHPDQCSGPNFE